MQSTPHDELLARHQRVMPSWLSLYYEHPIELVGGKGCRVFDAEGREYLDFFGGILTTMTGYGVAEVVEAIREQAASMLHTSTLYLIRPMVELAERIAELAPMPGAKVFFVSSGSEANEVALLMACASRRSNEVIALRNSYHGRSFATMAVTGNRSWSASSLSPVRVSFAQGGYRGRGPLAALSDQDYVRACTEDLEELLATTVSGPVACFIAEPVQGVGGFTVPPPGLLAAYKEVLDEHGIPFVSDEVQTGWGRTGETFWGIQGHGVEPDMMTFAKGLGNGLAIGGVVGRPELIDAVPASSISTFGGNPLACAGALANLEYLFAHDLQANALEQGRRLAGRLSELAGTGRAVAEVRGKGLMVGVELVRPGAATPWPEAAGLALEGCREAGLLVGKGGLYGNVLRIAPPLSVSADEVDEGASILVEVVRAIEQQAVSS
ncbi:MAG: aspartate aminotransferase family protein [Acidimicrobiales bacterium]